MMNKIRVTWPHSPQECMFYTISISLLKLIQGKHKLSCTEFLTVQERRKPQSRCYSFFFSFTTLKWVYKNLYKIIYMQSLKLSLPTSDYLLLLVIQPLMMIKYKAVNKFCNLCVRGWRMTANTNNVWVGWAMKLFKCLKTTFFPFLASALSESPINHFAFMLCT